MSVIVCIPIGAIGKQLVSGIVAWRDGSPEPCVTSTRDANISKTGGTPHKRRKVVCDGEVDAHQTSGPKNNSTEFQKS